MTAAVAGLLFGASLIVAIGAQNAYVLRQGARREHVLTVVSICAASDIILIAAGVAGGGVLLTGRPAAVDAVRVFGAAFLFGYAVLATRRALRPGNEPAELAVGRRTRVTVAVASLAFTWLNPGVYLDTVVLLGSVANTWSGRQWWFGCGAAVASLVWFTALGYGSRLLTPVLRRPGAGRVLDGLVAVVMVGVGLRVLAG